MLTWTDVYLHEGDTLKTHRGENNHTILKIGESESVKKLTLYIPPSQLENITSHLLGHCQALGISPHVKPPEK